MNMPRGRRPRLQSVNVQSLEEELEQLRGRQLELRQQIRRMRNGQGEVSKLEQKLTNQLGSAKWTIGQIRQIRPDWDEMGFYHTVPARQPAPRGRRRRAEAA
jgi:hypothetical protein